MRQYKLIQEMILGKILGSILYVLKRNVFILNYECFSVLLQRFFNIN